MLHFLLSFILFTGVAVQSLPQGSSENDEVIDLSHLGERMFGKPVENQGGWEDSDGNFEELGPYLEGDLLFPIEKKNAMNAESLRWKNGEVPFEIRGSYNAHQMDIIEKGLIEYHKNTCIKFIPRRPKDKDFISIESSSSGCWSSVGRNGGKQVVNLQAPGCVTKVGTVIHELMHALGFLHEQNREERDNFVQIMRNNIKPGYESNFDKAKKGETSGLGVTYDFGSVMHYSAHAFSKNKQPTIVAKSQTSEKMGQREGFSTKDLEKINKLYKCKGVTGTETPVQATTTKPNSILGSIFESFFPNSNQDEEEMLKKEM